MKNDFRTVKSRQATENYRFSSVFQKGILTLLFGPGYEEKKKNPIFFVQTSIIVQNIQRAGSYRLYSTHIIFVNLSNNHLNRFQRSTILLKKKNNSPVTIVRISVNLV